LSTGCANIEGGVADLPYRSYSSYLRQKYGGPVHRVCVDAGFCCPNRKDRAHPGCTYCSGDGGRAPYQAQLPLPEQVRRALLFLERRYGEGERILYFQAFSATNAPVEKLRAVYDSALGLAPFRELIVSTRPDCIDREKAALLRSYGERGIEVWVELGLQSARDETLKAISRGHTAADFLAAYNILKESGLKTAVHLIFGLPGETRKDMEKTSALVSSLEPEAVKIHNLHIPAGTPLSAEFIKGEVTAPAPERHQEYVIGLLEMLPPETLIMRMTCDTPETSRLAPRFFGNKQAFAAELCAEMRRRGSFQGKRHATATMRPGTPSRLDRRNGLE
jgi:uncharacterized protein